MMALRLHNQHFSIEHKKCSISAINDWRNNHCNVIDVAIGFAFTFTALLGSKSGCVD